MRCGILGFAVVAFFSFFSCQTYDASSRVGVVDTKVDLGSYSMNVRAVGQGSTVVFSGGSGVNDPFSDMSNVILPVSSFSKCVTYERQGYGRSSNSGKPRNVDQRVQDIERALTHVAAIPPYILVGHSYASLELLRFAQLFPEQVKGVVLIDGVPPHFYDSFDPESNWISNIYLFFFPMAKGMDLEKMTLKQDARTVYEAGTIGNIPLVYIQAASNGIPNWSSFQAEFKKYSGNSRTIVVDGTDHFIHHEKPEIVVEAIKDLMK